MTPSPAEPLLTATDVHRRFASGSRTLEVLRGVDLTVQAGEFVAILGRSGSGKSTLLHLLGGLDRPDEGEVTFAGDRLTDLSELRLDRYRSRHVGFIFQFYHLLPELSALENVLVGAMISRGLGGYFSEGRALRQRAIDLLHQVGLGERMRHRPAKLSGGERQRVAIARALINQPELLLADEPTGNLDATTSGSIMDVIRELHAGGQTIVMVTHDQNIAHDADRMLTLTAGVVDASADAASPAVSR